MTGLPALYVDRPLPGGFDDMFAGRADVVGPAMEELAVADGAIAGSARWDRERIAGASERLRVISRTGIGYDSVDLAAATARGIVVCNAPEAPTVSTAEHTLALLLCAAKRLTLCQQRLRDDEGDYFARNDAIELDGRTLGLVGFGRIARRVGAVGRALGMRVVACDPYLATAEGIELVDFATLLADADVISVHVPLTAETRHLFDAEAFAATKPGVVFVNAARGGLVDQAALLAALDRGQVGAAGLDVTEPEPLPPDHPLLHHPRVVVTPHIASATDRGKRRLYEHAIANALQVIAGERPSTVVNPEVYGA